MGSTTVEGYLHKWTNYIKGYKRRYFVLQDGLLSYYRNTAEIARICRGTLNIVNAKISVLDNNCFSISQGNIQTLHLKAPHENELNRWTNALIVEQDNAKNLKKGHMKNDSEIDSPETLNNSVSVLNYQLNDIKNTSDLLSNKFDELLRSIADLEKDKVFVSHSDGLMKVKTVKERATICRVTLAKLISAHIKHAHSFTKESERWYNSFDLNCEQRQRLECMVEQLGRQLRNLEKTVQRNKRDTLRSLKSEKVSEGSDDDFYDAFESQDGIVSSSSSSKIQRSSDYSESEDDEDILSETSDTESNPAINKVYAETGSSLSGDFEMKRDDSATKRKSGISPNRKCQEIVPYKQYGEIVPYKQGSFKVKDKNRDITASSNNSLKNTNGTTKTILDIMKFKQLPVRDKKIRRTAIPAKPNISMNLWSVVKNSIGKDISKIPMPVNFSEPISMLQRLAEDFEYSKILDKAAEMTKPLDQLPYIAAFTVSSYAATALRVNKPFNPLLGETYELDRTDDMGWRLIAEQLTHHPPECALHCESNEWQCWFSFSMNNKFRGKYLQIDPIGKCHLIFRKSQCHYVWQKVPMTVHNIIVGRIWIDNHGEIDIINNTTGDKCHLSYKAYSMFSADVPRRVTGSVTDKNDTVHYVLNGTWDDRLEAKIVKKCTKNAKGRNVLETDPQSILLWQRSPLMKDAEKLYFFSLYSVSLNEFDENVAPTDSRNRPDQRLMEEGHWEEANKEKSRLEENQRGRKAEVIKSDGTKEMAYVYKPLWFNLTTDPDTKHEMYLFNGKYWDAKEKHDWSLCSTIF